MHIYYDICFAFSFAETAHKLQGRSYRLTPKLYASKNVKAFTHQPWLMKASQSETSFH